MAKIIVLVNSNSIELITESANAELKFPADVIQNQEIINDEKYSGLVTNFFNENNLRDEKIVILLSESIIYEKKLTSSNLDEKEKETSNFLNTIPFENNKISLLKVSGDEGEMAIATNTELYSLLMDVCSRMNLKIEGIFPVRIIGEYDQSAQLWKTIPPLVDKIDKSTPLNFLISKGYTKGSSKKYWIAAIVAAILILSIIGTDMFLKSRQASISTPVSDITEKETSPSATASPSAETVAKTDLKMQVLNGSGVAGQAAEIKNELIKLGYQGIETGNYEGSASAETTASFSKKVDKEKADEIIKFLKTIFENVKQLSNEPEKFDIVIVTGKKI